MSTGTPMPTYYIPHGAGPCFFMDWEPPHAWDRMAAFLRGLAADLPAPPTAILVATAHWLAPQPSFSSAAQPGMLFDYYGFPAHTYELSYPAPGAPDLARHAAGLLTGAGFQPQLDAQRGYDHGTFVPLLLAFPQARVPVLQMSLLSSLDADDHLRLGAALQPLRAQGVLILGSGMSYHNQRAYRTPAAAPASAAFDRWLQETVALPSAQRRQRLSDWAQDSAPAGRQSHPPRREEHLLPLHVAAAAAGPEPGRKVFGDHVLGADIAAIRFG